jgi:UDP-N-acetylmuramoyl-L-alanyl-D-glutamate--2,6-diaminopimelate ligase
MQGILAARYADIVVLADEDPRGEDRMAIIEQIAEGCLQEDPSMLREDRLFKIPDRPAAIRRALEIAKDGDTVMFLGKGHESSIIYADHSMEWDEARAVSEALAARAKEGAPT